MKNAVVFGVVSFTIFHFIACRSAMQDNQLILLETELGDIIVEIYSDKAPLTGKNFMRYVDENRYKDAFFYRVVRLDNQQHDEVKIEVIQGGIGFVESDLRLPPIDHESTEKTGVMHKDGVISMARAAPGTASSEFFICIGDQPELNFNGKRNPDREGFAAFGSVVEGMDVIRKIHAGEADGQMLQTPVRITEIRRVKKRELQADSL